MSLNRNVSLATGLRYRGGGPMLTFVLHRIGGLGMAVFITMHILASFLGSGVEGTQWGLRELAVPDIYLLLRTLPCNQWSADYDR